MHSLVIFCETWALISFYQNQICDTLVKAQFVIFPN